MVTRPLLFFDGTNVMLIRAVDVPTPPDPEDKLWEKMGDSPQYKAICDKYNAALEAAKKKAIRVENVRVRHWASGTVTAGLSEVQMLFQHTPPGDVKELPEGYSYEERCDRPECVRHNETRKNKQCKYAQGGLPNCYIYAIIKPIAQPESEDELWRELSEIAWDDPTIYTLALKNMKSKYTIQRR